MLPECDYGTILRVMQWAIAHNGITEVRIIERYRGRTTSGYYNDAEKAANDIFDFDSSNVGGVYYTLNPPDKDCLSRCANRLESASYGTATKDSEISFRVQILLDFDPIRKSGISSTDEEHERALAKCRLATDWLAKECGFPLACLIDSGNGGHGIYVSEPIANTVENTELVRVFTRIMAERFNDEFVEVDLKMFNASRIVRCPGTVARKGDASEERPHRPARILRGHELDVLSLETLQKFVAEYRQGMLVKGAVSRIGYPIDEGKYRYLNDSARKRLSDWVPHLLHEYVHDYGGGWVINQGDLGRELEERISILPDGRITDFGEADQPGEKHEGHRTPVSLLAEVLEITKPEAAQRLANCLGMAWSEFSSLAPPQAVAGTMHAMPGELLGGDEPELAAPVRYNLIRHEPIKPVIYMIDQFLAYNTHTVFSGPAKTGKTTFTYDMMLHVLFGRPFLGKHVTKGKVLYIALEEREERFHRKVEEQLRKNIASKWPDMEEEEIAEGLSRLSFITRTSKMRDGVAKSLPVGFRGAEAIRQHLREYEKEWPGIPTLLIIEPVLLFSEERLYTRNLNKAEYEQIEIINDIVREHDYTVVIFTVKHDRKTPAGGSKGSGNIMDNASGTSAQQGAPDAQIQLWSDKEAAYSFTNKLNWLVGQSRDFGKFQIPLMSNGESWDLPPPGTNFPDFFECLNSIGTGVGAKKKDPWLDTKVLEELKSEPEGLSARHLSERLNTPEQIMRRTLDELLDIGRLTRHREARMKAGLYRLAEPVRMPNSGLRDII